MAASANPSGNNHEQQPPANGGGGGAASSNRSDGNSPAAPTPPDNSPAVGKTLKHNPGICLEWTAEEQSILEDGLTKYASDPSILRYSKIAKQLPGKTVRDVALRCKWMNFGTLQRKEMSKKRKDETSRKSRDKREKVANPSTKSSQPAPRPTGTSSETVSKDNDDAISYKAIGGLVGELLKKNAQTFEQISANFSSHQIQENTNLLWQARENIKKIMNSLSESPPEIMKQMPPLPVKLNEELANSILPQRQP